MRRREPVAQTKGPFKPSESERKFSLMFVAYSFIFDFSSIFFDFAHAFVWRE